MKRNNTNTHHFDHVLKLLRSSNFKILENDINQGMDINILNSQGQSLLYQICQDDHYEAARWLIDHGIQVNAKTNLHEETALMIAAGTNGKLTKLLIDSGADLYMKDRYGSIAAVYAAVWHKEESFLLLMQAGTDINLLFEGRGYDNFDAPFVMEYIENHFDQLTPKHAANWRSIRLKNLFK